MSLGEVFLHRNFEPTPFREFEGGGAAEVVDMVPEALPGGAPEVHPAGPHMEGCALIVFLVLPRKALAGKYAETFSKEDERER